MKATLSQHAGARPSGPGLTGPSAVFGLFGLSGAGAIGLVSGALVGWQDSVPSIGGVVAVYLMVVLGCAAALHASYPHRWLGLCNLVTLTRLVILGVLSVAMLEGLAPNALFWGWRSCRSASMASMAGSPGARGLPRISAPGSMSRWMRALPSCWRFMRPAAV